MGVLAETTTSTTTTKVSYIFNKCICCKQQFNSFTSSFINNWWAQQINFESFFIRTYICKTLPEFEISFQNIFLATFWILKIKQKISKQEKFWSSHHVIKLIHYHPNCCSCHHKQRCQRLHWWSASEITHRFYIVKCETKSRFLSFFVLFFCLHTCLHFQLCIFVEQLKKV